MKTFWLILILMSASGAFAQSRQIESVYTHLAASKCRTIESNAEEAGSYRGMCAATGGYRLEVLEGDLRQTINVVAASGKKSELNLWTVVSSGFSSLGEKAEWRATRKNGKLSPFALIIRFNASENPEDASKTTSYLVVSRIAPGESCVTDIIKPSANANNEARRTADSALKKPCLAPE